MTFVFAGLAILGHLVLLVGTHNYLYGQPYPKWVSKLVHLGHLVAFLALPIGLVAGWGFTLENLFLWPPSCATHGAILAYLAVCWLYALGVFPAVTLLRSLRRDPTLRSTSEVVVVPCRHSRHWLATLPGNEIYRVDYHTRELCPPRLPAALDGLKILHLSDLHFHGIPDRDYFEAVILRCNEWEPDIVALTGDIVDSDRHHRWIVPILGRLRWKVAGFAILGNHDHRLDTSVIRRRLRRIGFQVLANTVAELEVHGVPMRVIGHEGPWLQPEPQWLGRDDTFQICLSHTPDNIEWARQKQVDVMLSGHVHGGQIRVPVVGPVFMPSVYGRRYDQGVFQCDPTLLIVSRGLSGEHTVRYHCCPEVGLVTLRGAHGNPPPPGGDGGAV
jgi:predicted MPP superfamily phosphohydrolase